VAAALASIADNLGGDYLFLDLRPGPMHGCAGESRRDDVGVGDPAWPSVAAMLSDVANGLVNGADVHKRRPVFEDGILNWLPSGQVSGEPPPYL